MATTSSPLLTFLSLFFILLTLFTPQTLADCETQTTDSCNNKQKALRLKIIAIFTILLASTIGVGLPLCTRSVPALRPESSLFVIVKCFAAGIILRTGFVHVLPDSFDMLWSDCLQEKPWREFPFSGVVAMFSAIITLMVDSMATSIYSRKCRSGVKHEVVNASGVEDREMGTVNSGHFHHQHHSTDNTGDSHSRLLRYRVVAMVRY